MTDPHEVLKKVEGKRGLSGRIKDFFLLGYDTEEKLRANDKNIRMEYVNVLENLRNKWNSAANLLINNGRGDLVDTMKGYLTISDRVVEKIEHAVAGYAGFWNRAGKVDGEELAQALSYDISLSNDIDGFRSEVEDFIEEIQHKHFENVKERSQKLKKELGLIEDKFKERKGFFIRKEVE